MEFNSQSFSAFLAIALATRKLEKEKNGKEKFYFSCDFDGPKVTFTSESENEVSIRFKGFTKLGESDGGVGTVAGTIDETNLKNVLGAIEGDSDVYEVFEHMSIKDGSIEAKIDDKSYKENLFSGEELRSKFLEEGAIDKKLVFVLDEELEIGKIFGCDVKSGSVSFEGDAKVKCLKDKDNNVLADKFIEDAIKDFIKPELSKRNGEIGQKLELPKAILQKMSRYVKINISDNEIYKDEEGNGGNFNFSSDLPENLREYEDKLKKELGKILLDIGDGVNNDIVDGLKKGYLNVEGVKFKVKWEEEEAEEAEEEDSGPPKGKIDKVLNDANNNDDLFKIFKKVRSKVRYKGNKVVFLSGFSEIFDKDDKVEKLIEEAMPTCNEKNKNYFRKKFKEKVRIDLIANEGAKVFGYKIRRSEREILHDFLRTVKSNEGLKDKDYKFMKSAVFDNEEIRSKLINSKGELVIENKNAKEVKKFIKEALENELSDEGIETNNIRKAINDGPKDKLFFKNKEKRNSIRKKAAASLKKLCEGWFLEIK